MDLRFIVQIKPNLEQVRLNLAMEITARFMKRQDRPIGHLAAGILQSRFGYMSHRYRRIVESSG